MLLSITLDVFYLIVSHLSNLDLQIFCRVNKYVGTLFSSRKFWVRLLTDRYNYDSQLTVSGLRQHYYTYNFADRLLRTLGPKLEKNEKKDSFYVVEFRNKIRQLTLEQCIKYIPDYDFDLDYLLSYAIDTNSLELFDFCISRSSCIGRNMEDKVLTCTLIPSYLRIVSDNNYFNLVTILPFERLILFGNHDGTWGLNDLASRLDIRIKVSKDNIDKALEHAKKLDYKPVIQLLKRYIPPSITEELNYMLEYIDDYYNITRKKYTLPRWSKYLFKYRLRRIKENI